jgi:hypothetical protein
MPEVFEIGDALFFRTSRTRAAMRFSKEFDSKSTDGEVWGTGLISNLIPQLAQKRSVSLVSRPQFEQNITFTLHLLTSPNIVQEVNGPSCSPVIAK